MQTDPPPIIIGRDGAAMLALSLAIMTLSAGTSLAVAFHHVWRTARHASVTVDRIPARALVLGHSLDPSGQPTAIFRARLDRARVLAARWDGLELAVLGGRTGDCGVSEAEAGRRYLVAHGIPKERILLEDHSRHTLENLAHYRASLADGAARPVLITSRFHLARSTLLADGLGIAHRPCAAEDRWAPDFGLVRPLLMEALLIHWYITGRLFARWTRNRRMTARIS